MTDTQKDARTREIAELRKELVRQWETNHSEHCGIPIPPWPHDRACKWPMPALVLSAGPNVVSQILLSIWEESDEPR